MNYLYIADEDRRAEEERRQLQRKAKSECALIQIFLSFSIFFYFFWESLIYILKSLWLE